MPTIERILQLAPPSCYLASNYKENSVLGSGIPKSAINQSTLIYIYYKILNKIFTLDPTYPGLQAPANYLYELEKKFSFKAAQIIDGGGGGSVTPVTPTSVSFPFYIYSANFESDGVTYLNPKIVGVNIELFIDQYNQQFYAGNGFDYVPGGGFTITLPGFNANTDDWTIRVGRYFPIPT